MTRNCNFIPDFPNSNNALQMFTCNVCGCKVKAAAGASLRKTCSVGRSSKEKVGFHLSNLLEMFSFTKVHSCKCKPRAKYLDSVGADWCEQNIETIVNWLKEEASARGLPFVSTVGRMLVRRAISNARREAERAKNTR